MNITSETKQDKKPTKISAWALSIKTGTIRLGIFLTQAIWADSAACEWALLRCVRNFKNQTESKKI